MAMKERDALSFSGWSALLMGLGSIAASVVVFAMFRKHQYDPAPDCSCSACCCSPGAP